MPLRYRCRQWNQIEDSKTTLLFLSVMISPFNKLCKESCITVQKRNQSPTLASHLKLEVLRGRVDDPFTAATQDSSHNT